MVETTTRIVDLANQLFNIEVTTDDIEDLLNSRSQERTNDVT